MTEAKREVRVLEAVVPLVDSLLDDFDLVELVTELTERCADLLDVASSGVLVANPRGQLQLLAATTQQTHDLELYQLQSDEGPCVDAFASGHPVNVPDLHTETEHWPHFVPAAIEGGFAAVHAMPMRAAGTVIGALGLFSTSAGDLNPPDLLIARTLTHIATVAILQQHGPSPDTLIPRLQVALNDRVVVEQATGFLREELHLSSNDAFALLRRYARTNAGHLTDIARTLVSDPEARDPLLAGLTHLRAENDT